MKMAAQDLTSTVAANQLAAGDLFSVKMTTQGLTMTSTFSAKMTARDLTSPVAAIQLATGTFFPGNPAARFFLS